MCKSNLYLLREFNSPDCPHCGAALFLGDMVGDIDHHAEPVCETCWRSST